MDKIKSKMIKNKKKYIIIFIVILILFFIFDVIKYQKKTRIENNKCNIDTNKVEIIEEVEENSPEKIKEDKQVENLEITDINLVRENETTKFIAVVHNNTENKFYGSNAIVSFINKNGDVYYELSIYIPEINSNDIGEINAALPDDITNAYDFRISLNKE